MADMGFSVDRHDKDGDVWEDGIYLHIDTIAINMGATLAEFDAFIERLKHMRDEIEENLKERR